MTAYEYKVVPAPVRGEKARGLKTGAERYAHALEGLMNTLGADGWEYVRADTLPSEERSGLTGRTTVYHNLLVFRRLADDEVVADQGEHSDSAAKALLSFSRLRLGPARPAPAVAPRLGPAAPEASAPRLGPAIPDEDDLAT